MIDILSSLTMVNADDKEIEKSGRCSKGSK